MEASGPASDLFERKSFEIDGYRLSSSRFLSVSLTAKTDGIAPTLHESANARYIDTSI